jgi:hypothetical protein
MNRQEGNCCLKFDNEALQYSVPPYREQRDREQRDNCNHETESGTERPATATAAVAAARVRPAGRPVTRAAGRRLGGSSDFGRITAGAGGGGGGRSAGLRRGVAARVATLNGDISDGDGPVLALGGRWVLLTVGGDEIELAVTVAVDVVHRG